MQEFDYERYQGLSCDILPTVMTENIFFNNSMKVFTGFETSSVMQLAFIGIIPIIRYV